jgi:hypothetical protein
VPVRKGKRRPVVKDSYRTIYETFGFFQCSFAKAIDNWKTGTEEERRLITLTKEQRNTFDELTPAIIRLLQAGMSSSRGNDDELPSVMP